MKIAVSSTGKALENEVDPRFGRCQYFILVDPETMEFESMQNSNSMAAGGAGISTAQMIAERKVEAVITGNCGPNAYQVLSAAGITVMTGAFGTVKDSIERYKAGDFNTAQQANVVDHFGIGGRRGGGKGMRRSMNINSGSQPGTSPTTGENNSGQEIAELKQQLADIQNKIEELEEKRG
jgi:predicted Fe-Mo cluster-binding NifX family protein